MPIILPSQLERLEDHEVPAEYSADALDLFIEGSRRSAGAELANLLDDWSRDGKRHLLHTPGGTVRARQVVIAGNGYTGDRLHLQMSPQPVGIRDVAPAKG